MKKVVTIVHQRPKVSNDPRQRFVKTYTVEVKEEWTDEHFKNIMSKSFLEANPEWKILEVTVT